MVLAYDPEFAAALAPMAEMFASRPKYPVGDVSSRRATGNAALAAFFDQIPASASVKRTNHAIPTPDGATISISEFRKDGAASTPAKAIYYMHGGGMILGSVDIFEKSIAANVEKTNLPIFAVEYRLAPEHPHPTPVTDCWTGLQWLSANAAKLRVDPAKILIMGDSAGGGLAAGLALLARDQALAPPILKQILIFPMLDDRNNTPHPSIEPLATWRCNDNITGWSALLGPKSGDPNADISPYAAPARAKDLKGLPATYIDVGQLDIFVHEDTKYAARLVEADVPTEFHIYPGQPHAYQTYAPNTYYSKLAVGNLLKAIELA